MLVPVTYTGPNPDGLSLSWSTEPLVFKVGEATLVPHPLVPLLKELPGHGFSIPNAAAPSIPEGVAVVVAEAVPEPELTPADDEPAPAPAKKPGRKAKEA